MTRRFKIEFKSLLLAGALTLVGAMALAQTPTTAPPSTNTDANIGIDQKLDAQIPLDLTFTDQTGKQVKIGDYLGSKPVVLALPFYRCAGMCTLEMDGMAKAFNALSFTAGKEFNAVTLSIDPKETWTLAQAKQRDYLDSLNPDKRADAKQGWSFLTGNDANIHKLADAVGFRYIIDPKTQQPNHSVGIIILTPEGRVSRYMLGVDYSPKDLKLCLVDASHNKIGSLVDKFTLLCTHYDPTTSRYGVAIDRIIKFTCTLTVLILAGAILMMFRFEKQRTAEMIAQGLIPDPKATPSKQVKT